MIEVSHLTKRYGAVAALRDVSFRVEPGEVVAFLGPNGAGKTTTLRILAGSLGATSGRVRIAGMDVIDQPEAARARLGYMPEGAPLYPEMRVGEFLRFRAELKGVPRRDRPEAARRAMDRARVHDHEHARIETLSKGYRQRVALADALVASPPLLVLDEPTAGLDPNQVREVRALVRALAGEHTFFISTHALREAEAMCGRAIVVARGEVVAAGTLEELRRMRRAAAARLVVRGDAARAVAVAQATPGVLAVEEVARGDGETVTLRAVADEGARGGEGEPEGATAEAALERLVAALVAAGLKVREASVEGASLEEVFAELTAGARPSGGGGRVRGDEGGGAR